MSLSFPERSSSDLANLLEQGLSQEPSIMLGIPTRITVTGLMQVAARNLMGPAHHSLFRWEEGPDPWQLCFHPCCLP